MTPFFTMPPPRPVPMNRPTRVPLLPAKVYSPKVPTLQSFSAKVGRPSSSLSASVRGTLVQPILTADTAVPSGRMGLGAPTPTAESALRRTPAFMQASSTVSCTRAMTPANPRSGLLLRRPRPSTCPLSSAITTEIFVPPMSTPANTAAIGFTSGCGSGRDERGQVVVRHLVAEQVEHGGRDVAEAWLLD